MTAPISSPTTPGAEVGGPLVDDGALPLVVTVVKKREWINLLYLPAATWIAFSVLHTYALANVKGFRNTAQTWFVTPKTNHGRGRVVVRGAARMRAFNLVTLSLLATTYLQAFRSEPSTAGQLLVAVFAVLWIPSLAIAAVKS